MKLLGRSIDARELWEKVEARLQARGLLETPSRPISMDGPEPFVDPLSFHLTAIEAHVNPARPLPLEAPRTLPGRVANVARWALRAAVRPIAEEVFARQHLFNAHVRDAFAQLSAEVIRLKAAQEKPAPRTKKASSSTARSSTSRSKRPKGSRK